jgi:hypothetical protein
VCRALHDSQKRILLNDDRPRRLAITGKILGHKMFDQLATILTPETILRNLSDVEDGFLRANKYLLHWKEGGFSPDRP